MIGRVRGHALLVTLDVRGASTRFVLTSVAAVLLIFCQILPLYAQSSLHTDRSGYTTGTISSGSISTYSDGYGGTTGMIGNKHIGTYSDGYGNTTGTIGKDKVNLYTDRFGNISGTIGTRSVFCFADRFGNTRCN